MKKNERFFNSRSNNVDMIEELVSKITRGQFQIKDLGWTHGNQNDRARVTVTIDGIAPANGHSGPSAEWYQQGGHSCEDMKTPLSPDEKRIQQQIANCYL